jgi:hypothetical protein
VLGETLGPKSDRSHETEGDHMEETNGLYSTANIELVIKSRRMRWAGHVERTGERRNA